MLFNGIISEFEMRSAFFCSFARGNELDSCMGGKLTQRKVQGGCRATLGSRGAFNGSVEGSRREPHQRHGTAWVHRILTPRLTPLSLLSS